MDRDQPPSVWGPLRLRTLECSGPPGSGRLPVLKLLSVNMTIIQQNLRRTRVLEVGDSLKSFFTNKVFGLFKLCF